MDETKKKLWEELQRELKGSTEVQQALCLGWLMRDKEKREGA